MAMHSRRRPITFGLIFWALRSHQTKLRPMEKYRLFGCCKDGHQARLTRFRARLLCGSIGLSTERLYTLCGSFADELVPRIASFPEKLTMVAGRLSEFDNGPFPLIHGDFGHNNTVVKDNYQIIGLIDWEMAFAAPWEFAGDFPLILSTVPPRMDAPSNYDEDGSPKDSILAQKYANQKDYITNIMEAVDARNGPGLPRLLNALQDPHKQNLVTAMRLYYINPERWGSTPIWFLKYLTVAFWIRDT